MLGCAAEHFGSTQTVTVVHTGLGAYHGIVCFRRRRSLLISAPPALRADVAERAEGLTADDLDDVAKVTTLGGAAVSQIVGPASISYADTETFRPVAASATRLLDSDDELAVAQLRAACSPEAWAHGGADSAAERAGVFVDGILVALASYRLLETTLADLAIVTHPHYRGRGFGTAAVSAIGATALQRGLILQYRTLQHNAPSLRIAATLGFVTWATTVALRLHATSDNDPSLAP